MTHRGRLRAYLALARVSNLPTVWTNVLAGMAVAGGISQHLYVVTGAISLLYIGGMFLNDAFDAGFDARHRPDRPIPAGKVGRNETFGVGFALMAAGLALLAFTSIVALAIGAVLAFAVTYYDYAHKSDPLGPLVMGVCRGLVYFVAAAAASSIALPVWIAAVIVTAYVTGLTLVAKSGGARYGWSIKYLIAGISLVDALVIVAAAGSGPLALVAALGFPLTLVAQRWVSGT